MENQIHANESEGNRVDKIGRRLRTLAERQALLDRYRASGLSQSAFARQAGISLSALKWWLCHPPAKAAPQLHLQPVDTRPLFREVPALLEIEADGQRVRLLGECSAEFLRHLLAALKPRN